MNFPCHVALNQVITKRSYSSINERWYGQTLPVPHTRTMWRPLRLIKYSLHVKKDLISNILIHQNMYKPHLRKGSGGGTCKGHHPSRCTDHRKPRHLSIVIIC